MRSHAVEHDTLMTYFVLLLCISLGLLLLWNLPALSPHHPQITFRTSFLAALVVGTKLLFSGEMFHSTLLHKLYAISLYNQSLVCSERPRCNPCGCGVLLAFHCLTNIGQGSCQKPDAHPFVQKKRLFHKWVAL